MCHNWYLYYPCIQAETDPLQRRPAACYTDFDKPLPPHQLIQLLLDTPSTDDSVCKKRPAAVENQAVFIINWTSFHSFNDMKADEKGAFDHKGTPSRYLKVEHSASGKMKNASLCTKQQRDDDVYCLTRMYYLHKHSPEVRKIIATVQGKGSECIVYC